MMKMKRKSRLPPPRRWQALVAAVSLLLPTSVWAEGFTPWRTMHANSYPPTVTAAVQQCRDAGMAAAACDEFQIMLQTDRCNPAAVRDGTRYAWMGGRSGIARNLRKALGSDTSVLVCALPSGPVLHWYTGFAGACNNVGQLMPVPVARTQRLPPQVDPGFTTSVPAGNICGTCPYPGTYLQVPPSSISRQLLTGTEN